MTQNIIRARWLLNPQRLEALESFHPLDGLLNVEDLIGVDHERVFISNLISHQLTSLDVALEILADLDFECIEAFGLILLAQSDHFRVGVAEPSLLKIINSSLYPRTVSILHTWSGGVSAITVFDQISDTLLLAWLTLLQQLNRLLLRQDIRAVTEVDAVHEKLKIAKHKFNGFRFEFLAQCSGADK